MNISKKKLKERLLDICLGAGLRWLDEESYFEQDGLAAVGRAINAIETAFDIESNTSYLRLPWRLEAFEDIDDLTDLVFSAIEYQERLS